MLLVLSAAASIAVSCPITALTAGEKDAIAAEFDRGFFPSKEEQREALDESPLLPLKEALTKCERKDNWSRAKLEAASMWWVAELGRSRSEDRLRERGLSPEGIGRAYRSLDDAQRVALLNDEGQASDEMMQELMTRSDKEGPMLIGFDDQALQAFAVYVAVLSIMETAERKFTTD